MVTPTPFPKGLGQLEAYIGVEEGVAFEMNNGGFWDSLGIGCQWNITSVPEKRWSSKFKVTRLPSGKVMLENWVELFLAPVKVEPDPKTFPIEAVQYSEDPALQFDVFLHGDRVAFRANNGLFLSKVSREEVTVLEAAKFFADLNCSFRPLIGNRVPPAFEILSVIPKSLSRVKCQRDFLKKETYVNQSEKVVQHTFVMTWQTRSFDKTVWNNLWGLGVPSSCSFIVKQAKPIVKYSKRNERATSAIREISECQRTEVKVLPKATATAELFVYKQKYAVVPFTALVQKTKPNGDVETFHEEGAWKGLVYHDLEIEIRLE